MDRPKLYADNDAMQRSNVNGFLSKFIENMTWKQDEVILEIGCGPGDMTNDILYRVLQNKIKQLVSVDKSAKMIEYANKTYGCSKLNFKVLDIECTNNCDSYSNCFDKIFSFFCFHWVNNLLDGFNNMHLMLKHGGEILVNFLIFNPIVYVHRSMDEEWKKYMDVTKLKSLNIYSKDEIIALFIKAGFRVISVESDAKKFIFPDFSSYIGVASSVDELFNVLPPHLLDKYHMHIKDKMCEKQLLEICPTTGKTTFTYYPITVHAIKD